MPNFVCGKIQGALNEHSKSVRGAHIHIYGVSYKRDIDDVRESPAIDIMLLLQRKGAKVTYSDPHVPFLKLGDEMLQSQDESAAAVADCVAVITDHSAFDYKSLFASARLIVDTRNVLKGIVSDKIVRL